jgi:hypothetical protein
MDDRLVYLLTSLNILIIFYEGPQEERKPESIFMFDLISIPFDSLAKLRPVAQSAHQAAVCWLCLSKPTLNNHKKGR